MTSEFKHGAKALPSNLPCRHTKAGAVEWRQIAQKVRTDGGRLLSLWGADDRDRDGRYRVYAAYLKADGVAVIEHEMENGARPVYPGLHEFFPSALRMERAVFDLLGIKSMEPDHRGWLRHSGWPESVFPLRRDFESNTQFAVVSEPYPFLQVEGDGVHEIPVGPIHAGTIEPGHFRLSVVGEKVLRLEERLRYKPKGLKSDLRRCFNWKAARLLRVFPAIRRSRIHGPTVPHWRRLRTHPALRGRFSYARLLWSMSELPTIWAIWAHLGTTRALLF